MKIKLQPCQSIEKRIPWTLVTRWISYSAFCLACSKMEMLSAAASQFFATPLIMTSSGLKENWDQNGRLCQIYINILHVFAVRKLRKAAYDNESCVEISRQIPKWKSHYDKKISHRKHYNLIDFLLKRNLNTENIQKQCFTVVFWTRELSWSHSKVWI